MALDLTPNTVVGYRIKPDWYSFNVVLVKRHGASSKLAGQEYETTLAYHRTIEQAVRYIMRHAVRTAGLSAMEQASVDDSRVAAEAMMAAMQQASEAALAAARELDERIKKSGVLQKDIVKALGAADVEAEDEVALAA